MTSEVISSRNTWVAKRLAFWPPAVLALLLALGPQGLARFGINATTPLDRTGQLATAAVCALLSAWAYVYGARLRRVELSNQFLYVSDYRTQITVPLETVESVTEVRWLRRHTVTVHLRGETALGDSITFLPIMTDQWFAFTSHPIVTRIREMAVAAGAMMVDAPAA